MYLYANDTYVAISNAAISYAGGKFLINFPPANITFWYHLLWSPCIYLVLVKTTIFPCPEGNFSVQSYVT